MNAADYRYYDLHDRGTEPGAPEVETVPHFDIIQRRNTRSS